MTRTRGRRSLYEERLETTSGRLSLAAARLAHDASALLRETRAKSGMTNKDLAAALELSEGRVSQVMGGDGNVRLSTLARFMGAMGCSIRLVPELADGSFAKAGGKESVIEFCYGNSDGVGTAHVGVPHGNDGTPATLLWVKTPAAGGAATTSAARWKFHESSIQHVAKRPISRAGS